MVRQEGNAPVWLKVLLWLHVIAITIKCLPAPPPDTQGANPKRKLVGSEYVLHYNEKIKPFLEPYLWTTGVWQSWDMFAPNPSDWEGYVSANITYKDGTVKGYTYPRMYELGLGIKYFKERYRKFLERAKADAFDWLRPRFALRVAAKNHTDPNNPPVKVELFIHEAIVPKNVPFMQYLKNTWGEMRKGNFSLDVLVPPNPKMPPYTTRKYFTLVVPQAELKEMTGF